MTTLARYNEIVPPLNDPVLGCIPWAIEWMMRYKGTVSGSWEIPSNQLHNFQTTYNLHRQTNGTTRNTYANILAAIIANHPNVGLVRCTTYQSGQAVQKFQRIESFIGQGIPCITSIKLRAQRNAHIVPVVEIRQDDIDVIWNIPNSGIQDIQSISKTDLFRMHNAGHGTEFMYLP